jgi:D-erythrulose 1-phosphate 3-epimerase
MTKYKLGTNLICAGNRFPEPEVWTRILREDLDLDYVQFSADLLDPLWPKPIVDEYVDRTLVAVEQYRLTVHSIFSGIFSRRNLLMHPDQKTREMWFEWYKAFIRLGADLGAIGAGSPFGVITVNDANDPERRQARIDEAIRLWRELTFYARDCGLESLFFETMSTKRENPDTIEATLEFYQQMNEGVGLPTRLCLDVGHAPHPSQRDRYRWLRELAPLADIVHLQQSDENSSRHWPFTPEYNALGSVDPARVLEAIESTGVKEMFLCFEIFHSNVAEQEPRVIDELRESVIYWRKYLKDAEIRPD